MSSCARSDSHLRWRPYDGPTEQYVDPTCGMQQHPDYWRI
jgi:hypothetical protein